MSGIAGKLDPILEPLMAAVRRAERFLGPDDDWVEDDRRILFQWAQRHFGRWHTFTKEKGKEEKILTADADPDTVEIALMEAGYQRNLASNRKYRTHHGGGKQWAVGSFVYDPADTRWQHHVYLFDNDDGTTDIYGHKETSAEKDPYGHVTDRQYHGDLPPEPTRRSQGDAKVDT